MPFPKRSKDDGYNAYKRQVGKHETTRPSRVPTTVGMGRQKGAMYWETDPEKIMEFRKQYIARYGKEPNWDIKVMPGEPAFSGIRCLRRFMATEAILSLQSGSLPIQRAARPPSHQSALQ